MKSYVINSTWYSNISCFSQRLLPHEYVAFVSILYEWDKLYHEFHFCLGFISFYLLFPQFCFLYISSDSRTYHSHLTHQALSSFSSQSLSSSSHRSLGALSNLSHPSFSMSHLKNYKHRTGAQDRPGEHNTCKPHESHENSSEKWLMVVQTTVRKLSQSA